MHDDGDDDFSFTRREEVRDVVLLLWSVGGYSSIARLWHKCPERMFDNYSRELLHLPEIST